MKSQKSLNRYFKVSPTVLIENFRQFWIISMIGFLVYFIAGIFPLIVNYSNIENIAQNLEQCLENTQLMFILTNALLPIFMSIAIFKYLHSEASSTIIHSMPYSRIRLFNSGVLSGWLMLLAPILLTGILFLALSGAHSSPEALKLQEIDPYGNYLQASSIFLWMLETVIAMTFVYAISAFAAVIAGTMVMHGFLCFFLNSLMFWLTLIVYAYISTFLHGYMGMINYMKCSPITYSVAGYGGLSKEDISAQLCFVIVSILLIIVSGFLYTKIKLEREENATVFKAAGDIFCVLFSFIGMTGFGFILRSYQNGNHSMLLFYAGCIIGALLCFVIGRIIIEKTTKIFNLSNIKRLGVFTVLVLIFFSFTIFDVTGFDKRIPATSDIESITIAPISTDDAYRGDLTLSTGKNISLVHNLHQVIIDQELYESDYEVLNHTVTLTYNLKNGNQLKRSYSYWGKPDDPAYDYTSSIFESKEYKKLTSVYNTKISDVVEASYENEQVSQKISLEKMPALFAAIDKDYQSRAYADSDIDYNTKSINSVYISVKDGAKNMYITIRPSDKHTIAFFKDLGYDKYVNSTSNYDDIKEKNNGNI
ncbi:MAG: hypothetical protein RSC31_02255 [Anaerovoracaceae bacterium]